MGNVKCTPEIEVRTLTAADKGRVVQRSDGDFSIATAVENGIFLVSFRGLCQFVFDSYQNEPVVLFNSPAIVTPKLTSHRANVANEPLSLCLFFDQEKGGPLVSVNDPLQVDTKLYPVPASHRPTMPLPAGPKPPARWALFNLATGESHPGDAVLRRAYAHWTLDIANLDGSRTRVIDINETTIASAVAKQHNLGLR